MMRRDAVHCGAVLSSAMRCGAVRWDAVRRVYGGRACAEAVDLLFQSLHCLGVLRAQATERSQGEI